MSADVSVMPNFRSMQPEDIEQVLALGRSSLSYVDLATGDSDPHDYNSLYVSSDLTFSELDPADPDSPFAMNVVAEIDDRVVGFLLAYEHFVGIPVHQICVIQAIVVEPEFHGQGIGPRLVGYLQSKCKEKDINMMRILVPQQNTSLKHYLGSLGFHQSHVVNFDKPSWD